MILPFQLRMEFGRRRKRLKRKLDVHSLRKMLMVLISRRHLIIICRICMEIYCNLRRGICEWADDWFVGFQFTKAIIRRKSCRSTVASNSSPILNRTSVQWWPDVCLHTKKWTNRVQMLCKKSLMKWPIFDSSKWMADTPKSKSNKFSWINFTQIFRYGWRNTARTSHQTGRTQGDWTTRSPQARQKTRWKWKSGEKWNRKLKIKTDIVKWTLSF